MGLGDAVLRIVSTNTFAIAAWRGGGEASGQKHASFTRNSNIAYTQQPARPAQPQ